MKVFFIDDPAGKAVGINLFIGKRPFAALGNSAGDSEMLEWTGAGDGVRLTMLVYRDDTEREYAYGPAGGLPDTKVGAFPDSLMSEAKQKGWVVISMKADWKRAFMVESSWIRAGRPRARRPADRTGCYGAGFRFDPGRPLRCWARQAVGVCPPDQRRKARVKALGSEYFRAVAT